MSNKQEVSILENMNAVEVFTGGKLDGILEQIKNQVSGFIPDVTTNKGRNEIKAIVTKITKSKTLLEKEGKALSDKYRLMIAPINTERNKSKDFLTSLAEDVRKPLTDFEDAEKRRVAKHNGNILSIVNYLNIGKTSYLKKLDLEALIEFFNNLEFEEFSEKALLEYNRVCSELKEKIEALEDQEGRDKEIARLQKAEEERLQKDRDERIAKEARERAENEKKAIQTKAEEDRLKAEADKKQALADAEVEKSRLIKEAEESKKQALQEQKDKINAEKAKEERDLEATRLADEKRASNKRHMSKINKEALASFVYEGYTEGQAKKIITLIVQRKIKNVRVDY